MSDSPFTNPAGQSRENAARYTAALLELLGERNPLEVLEELPAALTAAVAGLDDAALRAPERPGKWSVLQVLWHLADSELVMRYRMRLVAAEPGREIQGYDQDRWAEGLRYAAADAAEALDLIRVLRAANLRWLRSLGEEELERAGEHAERGRESVRHMARLLAGHDLLHRRQIDRIRTALAAAR